MPGYIKPVGGHNRMRLVQPGYDVDTAPPNKVIFDSDDIGTLSVIATGDYTFNNSSGSPVTRQVTTWDLPYVPLCTFQFAGAGAPDLFSPFVRPGGVFQASVQPQKITVSKTGISMTFLPLGANSQIVRWVAYRMKAA